jgi:hypothetical protein
VFSSSVEWHLFDPDPTFFLMPIQVRARIFSTDYVPILSTANWYCVNSQKLCDFFMSDRSDMIQTRPDPDPQHCTVRILRSVEYGIGLSSVNGAL